MSNEVFAGFNRGPADPNTITMDSFSSNETSSGSGRKKRYRDAYDAASKFKAQTDYKAKQEAKAKENARAQRATMKIADDISVMEGYTDPGFTVQGQKGSGLLGTVGSAVGGYFGGPLGGQIGGAIGGSF
jgi:lipid-binding SYLF domain-containing protein